MQGVFQSITTITEHTTNGSPKDGQSLEDVEKLLLDQIEQVKAGNFEDWILPAVINDFKKDKRKISKVMPSVLN